MYVVAEMLIKNKLTKSLAFKVLTVGLIASIIYLLLPLSTGEICHANEAGCASIADLDGKYSIKEHDEKEESPLMRLGGIIRAKPSIHLSVVACGDRFDDTMTMIKSASLFSKAPIHVHIFADDDLSAKFQHELEAFTTNFTRQLTFTILPIQFPKDQNEDQWRKLFKPCASQRLFIPNLLEDVDALLYVDTDVLFLRPVEDLWNFFTMFNGSQIAGLAPEHEEPSASWYKRFARHPYVPPYGVNSGVMLMNLTRMRTAKWLTTVVNYYSVHRYDITWGDQDLINIYFHYFPEQLYQFSCDWNYRPDHCMYMSTCKPAEKDGVSVVHGCRSVFHNDKQPVFKAIYDAVHDYRFSQDLQTGLYDRMVENIKATNPSQCGRASHIFTSQLLHQVER